MFKSLISLLTGIGLLAGVALGDDVSPQYFFFGDSLTDMGYQNNNPENLLIQKTPIWTSPNGHTWAYYMVRNFGGEALAESQTQPNNKYASRYQPVPTNVDPILEGHNYAAGGATTGSNSMTYDDQYKAPSLIDQVQFYLGGLKKDENISQNYYFIFAGDNDIIKRLGVYVSLSSKLKAFSATGFLTEFDWADTELANNVVQAAEALHQAGASKIVIILPVDFSWTPLIPSLSADLQASDIRVTSEEIQAGVSTAMQRANFLIQDKVSQNPDLKHVLIVDVNRLFRDLAKTQSGGYFEEDMASFGQTKKFRVLYPEVPACTTDETALVCVPTANPSLPGDDPTAHVFEDLVHPTDQVHQIIGDYVHHQVQMHDF